MSEEMILLITLLITLFMGPVLMQFLGEKYKKKYGWGYLERRELAYRTQLRRDCYKIEKKKELTPSGQRVVELNSFECMMRLNKALILSQKLKQIPSGKIYMEIKENLFCGIQPLEKRFRVKILNDKNPIEFLVGVDYLTGEIMGVPKSTKRKRGEVCS